MTKYKIEKIENVFVVYNPACPRIKRRFETRKQANVYKDYLLERDKRALEVYESCFIRT